MPPESPQLDNSSYDFILNTEEPAKQPFISRINKKRLFGLLIILSIGLVVLLAFQSDLQAKAAEAQKSRLIGIAQMQTEISRVSAIAITNAEKPQNKDRAQAIHDNMQTTLEKTKSLLVARQSPITDEELGVKKDTATDDQLTKAVTFSNFDKTFEKLIDEQLTDYQRALLAAQKAGNAQEKQVLDADYNDANSILGLTDG